MTILRCPAKINLFLAIKDRDSSGYHEIDTIFARANNLADLIHIEEASELTFECQEIPGENNLLMQAIRLLEKETNKTFTYKIRLEKKIPLMSGLGGGSSNAAAIMLYLNEHEGLDLPHNMLMELAAEIGMDIPFFISGNQVARGTHYGEVLAVLPELPKNLQLTIHAGKQNSTKEAFQKWDESGKKSTANPEALIAAIKKQDAQSIIENLHNDFEIIYGQASFSEQHHAFLLSGSGGAYVSFDVI